MHRLITENRSAPKCAKVLNYESRSYRLGDDLGARRGVAAA
jgi:hypothetical protein